MISIITATILLAFVHALIPNHWLPLVSIAKAEKWVKTDLMLVASITASAHVVGTVVIGIALGMIGANVAQKYGEYVHIMAPLIFILFGLLYFSINLPHHHNTANDDIKQYKQQSKGKWILIFSLMMFLSPCLEVESLFLASGAYGLDNILFLAVVYALVSISGIIALVMLAYRGIELIHSRFVEENEKRITGMVLIIVGILTFFLH